MWKVKRLFLAFRIPYCHMNAFLFPQQNLNLYEEYHYMTWTAWSGLTAQNQTKTKPHSLMYDKKIQSRITSLAIISCNILKFQESYY